MTNCFAAMNELNPIYNLLSVLLNLDTFTALIKSHIKRYRRFCSYTYSFTAIDVTCNMLYVDSVAPNQFNVKTILSATKSIQPCFADKRTLQL